MDEPGFEQSDGITPLIRAFFAVVLLVFGISVALWLVFSLIALLGAKTAPALVDLIVPAANKPIVVEMPEGKFTLPPEVFRPVGYLLVCFVYAIAAGLTAGLINGGVSLLQLDIGKLLRRLVLRLENK